MQPFALGQGNRIFVGSLEITSCLDEPRDKPLHRAVLFDAVAARDDDRRLDLDPCCRKRDALPVIPRGGGHNTANIWVRALDLVEIDEATAELEGADRRVVLVLDPKLGADPPRQQRPAKLRGRWHHSADEVRGSLQRLEIDHDEFIPLIFLAGSSRAYEVSDTHYGSFDLDRQALRVVRRKRGGDARARRGPALKNRRHRNRRHRRGPAAASPTWQIAVARADAGIARPGLVLSLILAARRLWNV